MVVGRVQRFRKRRWPRWRTRTSHASRCRSSGNPGALLAEWCGEQDLPTGLGAEDIDEYSEIYAEWVWQYWMSTGDRVLLQELYPVLVKLSGYVHDAVDRSTGLVTGLQTTESSYPYRVATRLNILGANVFRRTADVAQVLGRPSVEVTRSADARRR